MAISQRARPGERGYILDLDRRAVSGLWGYNCLSLNVFFYLSAYESLATLNGKAETSYSLYRVVLRCLILDWAGRCLSCSLL
jgi:hypothetical protein